MTDQYVSMLVDSLQKKKHILEQITALCDRQSALVKAEELDLEAFDKAFDEKGALISQLDLLDDGFDAIFGRVKEVLSSAEGKKAHAAEIMQMQDLIRAITDLSMHIQTSEQRNKAAIEQFFAKEKTRIKQGREGSSAALNYYLNMKNRQIVPPHFYDNRN